MDHPRPIRRRRLFAVTTVLLMAVSALGAAPVAMAEEKPEPPKTALERFDVALVKARDLVHNASVKLRNGIRQGVTHTPKARPGEHGRIVQEQVNPEAPGVLCCSGNLERLSDLYRELTKELAEVKACYQRSNVERSLLDSMTLAEEDLQSLTRATERFSRAPDEKMADGSVAAMQRSWLLLKKSRDGLADCR